MDGIVLEALKGMGVAGAIIFVLLSTVGGLVAVIKAMQKKADKVYGYRLAERDALNKALTDTTRVLGDMLKATEERNDLASDQAELIAKQSAAFELLKVTVLAQYDTIRNNHAVVAQTVTAMADSIRTLNSVVQESRMMMTHQIGDLHHGVGGSRDELKAAITAASQAQLEDLRRLLGAELAIIQRRPKSPS